MNHSIKKLWRYIAPYKLKLLIIFCSIILYILSKVSTPYLTGLAVDQYIATFDLTGLSRLLMLLTILFFSTSFFGWLQTFIMIGVAGDALKKLRDDLFAKMEQLSISFFDSTPHGELMSRFTNDIDNINTTLSQNLVELISNILTLIGVTLFMFLLNIKLAIATIISTPLIIIATRSLAGRTKTFFALQQQQLGTVNGFIEENISGFKSIKAYGMGNEISSRFSVVNNQLKDHAIQANIYSGVVIPLMNTFNNVNLAIVAGYGAWLTLHGQATVGLIVTFINFARQFFQPLNQIANLYNQIQLAITGTDRVFEIMDKEPEIVDKPNSVAVDDLEGEVDFNDVDFGYTPEKLVLKDIDLHSDPGQMIALIGPTGSGKSTIINLLTRFYDVDAGEIYLDDHEIQDIKIKSLRDRLGVVLQDTTIFSGTIKDNIKYGKLDATDEEVIQAAKLANIHDYIETLPYQYDTEVDENASILSMGQKQLISIARTVLSDPDILILDEATSNIDTRTEMNIQEAMNNIMKGRTTFVIAHRLKTILNADQILVLKNGEIIERGNHSELLKKNGFYAELYKTQFDGKA